MLRSAPVLLTIAIIAAIVGYSDLGDGSANVALIIFFIALILVMLVLVIDDRSTK
ncbi:MAG: DUF1328 domain-containing protein [Flavobacteriales bacterium]|nr:DUF1328 domain-containing protein [Flavobacteriales bacterium]